MYIVNGAVLERWSSLTDEQIVAQVVSGHTALFELVMRRHHERLYCAALAVLRDDREAEDVVQQAYLNAYARLRQFDRHTRFATWLTGIVNDVLARVAIAREHPAPDAFAVRQTRCDRVVAAVLRRIE
jgi:RNA polymerase sigma-70 factor (ECF subfamily)